MRSLFVAAAAAVAMLGLATTAGAEVSAQTDIEDEVAELVEAMTPRQRVGQLFVVPYHGAEIADGTDIAELIDEYHVGGVVLDPRRGNFTNSPDAPTQVARAANALQARVAESEAPFAPLFVALPHLGNGFPTTLLHGGMTELPSQMALGATWDPEHAERVGEIVGSELAAVGVNLLLGPSLDVTNVPRPDSSGDLGVLAFGGSPPWVARFGQHYMEGVHRGAGSRVATAAGSFPGIGGADRSQAEEGAVVEGTLPELAAVELVSFASAADGGGEPDAVSDAFVSSHVRYRGVQQQSDRPMSLDSGGLRYLWAQVPELTAWRELGGVLVSPGLGLPAVRTYVDPSLETFNPRRVAGEALAAGNDLLVVTSFGPPNAPESGTANIEDAIVWLAARYEEDETVRDAVDGALARVLRLKLRMYGRATVATARVSAESAAVQVGLGGEVVAAVARDGLTAIMPAGAAGASGVGGATASPAPGDRILLVVDARQVVECADCPPYLEPDPAHVLDFVMQTYGPEGTARVRLADDVAVATFEEVKAWLQATGQVAAEDTPALVAAPDEERLAEVGRWVEGADWLVFAMRDVRPAEAPGSDALKLYLKSIPPGTGERSIVAVALGAPYYLDTTEIAKLTAYYAAYSHTRPFVEAALRALFGDGPAPGASPVSVSGAGYDLDRRLEPDPDQEVALEFVGGDPAVPLSEGDALTVRTSMIHDRNGNAAPDGTPVTFRRYDRAEDVFLPDVPAKTDLGRATGQMRAERGGELVITAVFENGLRSAPLELSIESAEVGSAAVLPLPEVMLPRGLERPQVPVDWGVFVLSLTLVLLAGVLFYGFESAADTGEALVARMRVFLLILAWGLAGYLLVAAGGLELGALPGGSMLWPADWNVAYQAPLLAFAFALVPVVPSVWRAATGRSRR
ncbi:MAG: glycoside hydrolase family 3 N-terminal domain-containing protein [Anaerolineae bacterium]